MKLTEHFALEELTHSDMAVRMGIDNTPPQAVVQNLIVLAAGLEQIRSVTGHPLHINSGYRCEELERVLCAKDFAAWCARQGKNFATSWTEYFERKGHPRGFCADFTCRPFGTPLEIIKVVRNCGIRFDQLIEEGTWCHASFDPRLRGEILTATFDKHGTPTYTQGIPA